METLRHPEKQKFPPEKKFWFCTEGNWCLKELVSEILVDKICNLQRDLVSRPTIQTSASPQCTSMQWRSLYTCTDAKQLNTLNVSALLQPTALELISLKLTSLDNNAPKQQSFVHCTVTRSEGFCNCFSASQKSKYEGWLLTASSHSKSKSPTKIMIDPYLRERARVPGWLVELRTINEPSGSLISTDIASSLKSQNT